MIAHHFLFAAIASLLFVQTNAVEFEVVGKVDCQCTGCHSVANVQLWEDDTMDPDDLLGETIVRQSRFSLKFDQSEVFGVDPYLVLRHDCAPELWNEQTGRKREGMDFCFVEEKHDFKAPVGDQTIVELQLEVGLPGEQKDREICAPELEFRRIFGGGPLGAPTERPNETDGVQLRSRGRTDRLRAEKPTVLLAANE
ncbi:hypothetical protein M3Y99_01234300 [Aphelenchoides fujianensis]|nr:hypothetical protein M3Y99_01234300 [Aphelenchoides fujianensis]